MLNVERASFYESRVQGFIYAKDLTLDYFTENAAFFVYKNKIHHFIDITIEESKEGDNSFYLFCFDNKCIAKARKLQNGTIKFNLPFGGRNVVYPLFFKSIDEVKFYFDMYSKYQNVNIEKAKQAYAKEVSKLEALTISLEEFQKEVQ